MRFIAKKGNFFRLHRYARFAINVLAKRENEMTPNLIVSTVAADAETAYEMVLDNLLEPPLALVHVEQAEEDGELPTFFFTFYADSLEDEAYDSTFGDLIIDAPAELAKLPVEEV